MAGFLKALYKLLYALGVCDFQPLTQRFFPVQALGFLLAGCGETGSTGRKHENNRFPACLTGGGNLRKIRLNDKRN